MRGVPVKPSHDVLGAVRMPTVVQISPRIQKMGPR